MLALTVDLQGTTRLCHLLPPIHALSSGFLLMTALTQHSCAPKFLGAELQSRNCEKPHKSLSLLLQGAASCSASCILFWIKSLAWAILQVTLHPYAWSCMSLHPAVTHAGPALLSLCVVQLGGPGCCHCSLLFPASQHCEASSCIPACSTATPSSISTLLVLPHTSLAELLIWAFTVKVSCLV